MKGRPATAIIIFLLSIPAAGAAFFAVAAMSGPPRGAGIGAGLHGLGVGVTSIGAAAAVLLVGLVAALVVAFRKPPRPGVAATDLFTNPEEFRRWANEDREPGAAPAKSEEARETDTRPQ